MGVRLRGTAGRLAKRQSQPTATVGHEEIAGGTDAAAQIADTRLAPMEAAAGVVLPRVEASNIPANMTAGGIGSQQHI